MSKQLIIIARIEANPEKLDLVKSETLKLIEPSRKEQGCIQYDLQQDNNNPEVFIFYEIWESAALWEKHMENTHLKAFITATNNSLVSLDINQMTLIK